MSAGMRTLLVAILAATLSSGCLGEWLCGSYTYYHARIDEEGLFERFPRDGATDSFVVHTEPAEGLDSKIFELDRQIGPSSYAVKMVRWGWDSDWRMKDNDIRLQEGPEVFMGFSGDPQPASVVKEVFKRFLSEVSTANSAQIQTWSDAFYASDGDGSGTYRLRISHPFDLDAVNKRVGEPEGTGYHAGQRSAAASNAEWEIWLSLEKKVARRQGLESGVTSYFSVTAMDSGEYVEGDGRARISKHTLQARLQQVYDEFGLGSAPTEWDSHKSSSGC